MKIKKQIIPQLLLSLIISFSSLSVSFAQNVNNNVQNINAELSDKEKKYYNNLNKDELLTLAEKGDVNAQYLLGLQYNFEADKEKAKYWLEKAAAQKYNKAIYALDLLFNQDRFNNKHRAHISNLEKLADKGESNAQTILALLYINGKTVPKDYTKAVDLLTKASDSGNPEAQYVLGNLYFTELHNIVKKDDKKARELFEKSANQNNSDGQLNLGLMYIKGAGGEKNIEQGINLIKQSCKNNNKLACFIKSKI